MEIAGLNEDTFCELPDLFTQRSMPVHCSNIPHQEDLERWPHLKRLKITKINAGVDLLIETNVPKALEPWDIIQSQNGGPNAVRTILGWTVNGPLRGNCDVNTRDLQSIAIVTGFLCQDLRTCGNNTRRLIFLSVLKMNNLDGPGKIISS